MKHYKEVVLLHEKKKTGQKASWQNRPPCCLKFGKYDRSHVLITSTCLNSPLNKIKKTDQEKVYYYQFQLTNKNIISLRYLEFAI